MSFVMGTFVMDGPDDRTEEDIQEIFTHLEREHGISILKWKEQE